MKRQSDGQKRRCEENILALHEASQFRPPLLFLGAGFSIEAGYISTSDLMERLKVAVDVQTAAEGNSRLT